MVLAPAQAVLYPRPSALSPTRVLLIYLVAAPPKPAHATGAHTRGQSACNTTANDAALALAEVQMVLAPAQAVLYPRPSALLLARVLPPRGTAPHARRPSMRHFFSPPAVFSHPERANPGPGRGNTPGRANTRQICGNTPGCGNTGRACVSTPRVCEHALGCGNTPGRGNTVEFHGSTPGRGITSGGHVYILTCENTPNSKISWNDRRTKAVHAGEGGRT